MLTLSSQRMGCAEQRFEVYSPAVGAAPDAEASKEHIHHFESEIFKGRFFLVSPVDPKAYFGGRQRQFQVVVQGSFTREVKVSDLYVGQLWDYKLQSAPPHHVKNVLDPFLRLLQPSLKQEICGDHPYLLSPAFATLQTICITGAGAELPDIADPDSLVDDLSLLSSSFAGMTAVERKKYFSRADEEVLVLGPSVVCTLDFYTHAVNINSFDLLLGYFHYCVAPILGSRNPIMHLLLEWDGEGAPIGKESSTASHAYCLEIWQEEQQQAVSE